MPRLTHYPWQAGSLPENLFTLGYLGLRADAVQLTFRTIETQQRPCQTVSSQQKKRNGRNKRLESRRSSNG